MFDVCNVSRYLFSRGMSWEVVNFDRSLSCASRIGFFWTTLSVDINTINDRASDIDYLDSATLLDCTCGRYESIYMKF